MKFNKKCVQNMYMLGCAILVLGMLGNCTRTTPEQTELLTVEYPELYASVFERDAQAILEYVDSEDSLLSTQAWKAMISTPTEDVDILLEKAKQANTKEAWASLWFKEINEQQLARLHQLWEEGVPNAGLASVLGLHGDFETLSMLLEAENVSDFDTQFELALAVGRLSMNEDLSKEHEMAIIKKAFSNTNGSLVQAYLYGIYRIRKDLDEDNENAMLEMLENFYPDTPAAEQYLTRILMKNHMDVALFRFELDEFQTMDVQLAIEISRGIARYTHTKHAVVILNAMLDHVNPNVKMESLLAIQSKPELLGELDRAILNKIGLIRGIEPSLRLEALNTIENPKQYEDIVYELAGEDPYLRPKLYSIQKKMISESEFLEQLKTDIASEQRLIKFFGLQELAGWWGNLEDDQKVVFQDEVKREVREVLGSVDRSMTFVMASLLRDSMIIEDSEYSVIEEFLGRFKLPEDVEVYQAISSVLKERFEEEAKPLIDSLAALGNGALNQTLRNQGWDIGEGSAPSTTFRQPDWERLTRLGAYPTLVLETNKGDISIQMDVFAAPATISGMDSLITARAYNRIPFHRVIPNFVIQGGDIETQDGFGGPDYVVPTESSVVHYYRGKVGIASAGTDTEGSQFFIMHDWMPHLTGRYTIIGEVLEGMDVVDRIVRGDYIEKAYWQVSLF